VVLPVGWHRGWAPLLPVVGPYSGPYRVYRGDPLPYKWDSMQVGIPFPRVYPLTLQAEGLRSWPQDRQLLSPHAGLSNAT